MGKYLDMIRQHERTQPEETLTPLQAIDQAHTVHHPGDRIKWQRADLSIEQGVIDMIHTDDTGTRWAFVTVAEGWAAVNVRFVKGVQG